MGKNTKGGSKHKKQKRVRVGTDNVKIDIEQIKAAELQEYAYITAILGNCRFNVQCHDDKPRLAHMRGKLRKRAWCNKGDLVLIGLRSFQDDKCDILHKYNEDEIALLINKKCISESFAKDGKALLNVSQNTEQEISFVNDDMFGDNSSDDSDSDENNIVQPQNNYITTYSSDDDSLDIDNI